MGCSAVSWLQCPDFDFVHATTAHGIDLRSDLLNLAHSFSQSELMGPNEGTCQMGGATTMVQCLASTLRDTYLNLWSSFIPVYLCLAQNYLRTKLKSATELNFNLCRVLNAAIQWILSCMQVSRYMPMHMAAGSAWLIIMCSCHMKLWAACTMRARLE